MIKHYISDVMRHHKKKELLFSVTKKDFEIQWFSGQGAGGQKRNKTQNCCRMVHIQSGATATGQSNKERPANLRQAFRGVVNSPKFKLWHTAKSQEFLTGKSIEKRVNEAMSPKNLKVECKQEGKWTSACPEI